MHTMQWRPVLAGATIAVIAGGCGHRVAPGVRLNTIGVVRTSVSSEAPIGRPEFDPRHPSNFLTVKHADVVGDPVVDDIALMPGEKGLEIRDGASKATILYRTDEFVTDFGAIPSSRSARNAVVVYTYPNPEGGGSFRVFTLPERTLEAEWKEPRGVGSFETVTFGGRPALAYLRHEHLIVRDARGTVLKDVIIQGADIFRTVWISALTQGRLAVVASGDGYTQQHMVAVLDAADRLAYQEVRDTLASKLEVTGNSFDVWAVGGRDRYTLPAAGVNP